MDDVSYHVGSATEPKSSGRTANAFNYGAISLVLGNLLLGLELVSQGVLSLAMQLKPYGTFVYKCCLSSFLFN